MFADWPLIAQWTLVALSILLAVPAMVLLVEVLAALATRAPRQCLAERPAPLVVLIPAHNEAGTIAATLASVRAELSGSDRLLVIADNCQDDTASVARAAGAEVIERRDSLRRGKGFALDFGIRHLSRGAPPPIVIIVDADCQLAAGSLDALARRCNETGRPTQARYLMLSPPGAGPLRRIAEFAWLVRNDVRARGLQRLGGPCQLMGSGMAFAWDSVARGQLASGHLVEDLKLGIELAEAGRAPLFCPEARVTSTFPSSREGVRSQRTRWEHGYLSVLLTSAPRLLARSLARANVDLLALALDLTVPPLALLVLMAGAVWAAALALGLLTAWWLALAVGSALLGMIALAVLLAWLRFGRQVVALGDLALAGVYVFAKLPLYLRFLVRRQHTWVRSRRDGESQPPV
jgi:cellulose synthase/poly-beta-1,6-N-acetylglucosamine synthase-like glycosyltransferase